MEDAVSYRRHLIRLGMILSNIWLRMGPDPDRVDETLAHSIALQILSVEYTTNNY